MWKARTNSSSLIVASAVLVAFAAFAWSGSAVSALMLVSALMIGHPEHRSGRRAPRPEPQNPDEARVPETPGRGGESRLGGCVSAEVPGLVYLISRQ